MFLATGTGHCGTKWFSRYMSALGYPCGHEKLFNPWNASPLDRSESSLFAMPFLPGDDVPVVHLVRDPVRVLNSCLRMGTLVVEAGEAHRFPYSTFYHRHLPALDDGRNQVERLVTYIDQWDRPVENHGNRLVIRVGDPGDVVADNWDGGVLAEMVRHCTGDSRDPEALLGTARRLGRINEHRRDKQDHFTWDSLPDGGDILRKRAERYGLWHA